MLTHKHVVKKGSTSRIEYVFIHDSNGDGVTGLTFSTSGLTAYYVRKQGSATSIALVTQTVTGAYSSGGFVEVDATNMPGLYRLDVPDACFASGVDKVIILLQGATGMVATAIEYQLVDYNSEDSVRLGLTALPNAAAAANGGLPTVDANNAVKLQSGVGANQIDLSSGAVKIQAGQLFVKKNTALSNFPFLMVDVSDHVTPKTGLTVTAQRSIDGGAFAACTNSPSELSNGIYLLDLAAADVNGTLIVLKFSASGADTRYIPLVTQA